MRMLYILFAVASLLIMPIISFAERVAALAFSLIPTDAKPSFRLDNGHPRSPLASMRAGLA